MDKWLYRALVALAYLGLAVAIYMTIYKVLNADAMCLGSGDCSTVNASSYSEVYGFPVGGIGAIGYAAILATLYLEKRSRFFRENGALLLFGMALTGFLFTLWLVYVEFAILKALCPFCLTSQIAMTIIFILVVIRLIKNPVS
jgi:uncharacterized membrane protein